MPASSIRSVAATGLEVKVINSARYASQLAHTKLVAFKLNPLNTLMFPFTSNANGITAWLEEREIRDLASHNVMTVAVIDTENDEILARAKWKIPTSVSRLLNDEFSENPAGHSLGETTEQDAGLPNFPEGFNLPLNDKFRTILQVMRDKCYNPDTDYCE